MPKYTSDDEDFFAVMLPDDVIEPTAAMSEMIRVRQEHGGSVLLAVEVDQAQVSNYGVFDIEDTDQEGVKKVVGMVEKPASVFVEKEITGTEGSRGGMEECRQACSRGL